MPSKNTKKRLQVEKYEAAIKDIDNANIGEVLGKLYAEEQDIPLAVRNILPDAQLEAFHAYKDACTETERQTDIELYSDDIKEIVEGGTDLIVKYQDRIDLFTKMLNETPNGARVYVTINDNSATGRIDPNDYDNYDDYEEAMMEAIDSEVETAQDFWKEYSVSPFQFTEGVVPTSVDGSKNNELTVFQHQLALMFENGGAVFGEVPNGKHFDYELTEPYHKRSTIKGHDSFGFSVTDAGLVIPRDEIHAMKEQVYSVLEETYGNKSTTDAVIMAKTFGYINITKKLPPEFFGQVRLGDLDTSLFAQYKTEIDQLVSDIQNAGADCRVVVNLQNNDIENGYGVYDFKQKSGFITKADEVLFRDILARAFSSSGVVVLHRLGKDFFTQHPDSIYDKDVHNRVATKIFGLYIQDNVSHLLSTKEVKDAYTGKGHLNRLTTFGSWHVLHSGFGLVQNTVKKPTIH